MTRLSTSGLIATTFALASGVTTLASAQTAEIKRGNSIAIEADAISYFIGGYSGIVNLSLRNGFQIALGTGRYDVPSFLLEGDANYDAAEWKATSTSVQVMRVTYRFKGPLKNGPALGVVALHENWTMRSAPLAGETKFRPFRVGITAGYYLHVGRHFYLYPTAAFTSNSVLSGETSINGTNYKVEKLAPNGSLHAGWEWGW